MMEILARYLAFASGGRFSAYNDKRCIDEYATITILVHANGGYCKKRPYGLMAYGLMALWP